MDKLAEKMAELAERFGPNVIDAARGAVRVEAYSSMMASGIALIAFIALAFVGNKLFQKGREKDSEGYFVVGVICLFAAVIVFFPAIWGFLDPWVYTAINNPDLYLAKKIFKL